MALEDQRLAREREKDDLTASQKENELLKEQMKADRVQLEEAGRHGVALVRANNAAEKKIQCLEKKLRELEMKQSREQEQG